MGCDIHGFIEYDYAPMCTYQVAKLRILRDYRLFALMAGLRWHQGEPPLHKPKGLPEKISYSTRDELEFWGSDGHTTSWLSLAELKQILGPYAVMTKAYNNWRRQRLTEIEEECGMPLLEWPDEPETNRDLMAIIAFMEAFSGDKPEQIRLVFWFDN